MLDTDTCSYIIANRSDKLRKKMNSVPMASICISVITYAELCYGVEKANSKTVDIAVIEEFTRFLNIFDWTARAAQTYGAIRNQMEKKGCIIGNLDLQIAAHALSIEATLITNNVKHFKNVPKLSVSNWLK